MPVKPKYVKDVGKGVMRKYPNAISTDFEHNKELVEELTNIESKSVKNSVAGYLVTLKNRELRSEGGDIN